MYKNKCRLFTMLLLFFFVGSMKASYLTVYQGTVENGLVPFGGVNFNYNTRSQYVIPAANLKNMVGGDIYCLMYYLTNFNAGEMPEEKVKVYMKEVNYTTISTFEPLSANDLVYEGTLTESETSGIRLLLVTLDKPFIYKGGNLLIDFENTETGTALGKKFYGKTVNGASITTLSIGQSVSQCNFIPQTTFLYNAKPTITNATSYTPTTATVGWTGENKNYKLRYSEILLFEDFENGLGDWTVISNGGGQGITDWQLIQNNGSNNASYEGSYGVIVWSYRNKTSYNVDNWLISPQVKLGGTLKYWVRVGDASYPEHYKVYVSTTDKNVGSFVELASPGDATNTWTEVSVDLSAYEGQTGYIAFRDQSNDQYNMLIDNVRICIGSTVVDNATSPCTIKDLQEDKNYLIEVAANVEDVCWTQTPVFTDANPMPYDINFNRSKNETTISWTGFSDSYQFVYRKSDHKTSMLQGFEHGYDGWKRLNCIDKSDGNSNPMACKYGHAGFAFCSDQVHEPQYLISPRIPKPTEGTKLSFYYRHKSSKYPESFMVGYSSTTDDIDAFTFGETITTSQDDWEQFLEDIPAGTKYICIKYVSDDMWYLLIDHIEICKLQEASGWQAIGDIFSPSITLDGLEADTQYDITLRGLKANCKNGISSLTEVQPFRTLTPLQLADNDANLPKKNIDIIEENERLTAEVTLTDRTLYKDGDWNTLCLPFNVKLKGSVLEGATVKKLNGEKSSLEDGKMILTFEDEKEELTAGIPYIIKWEQGDDITNPVFEGVDISSIRPTEVMSNDGQVSFVGQYSSFNIVESGATGENEGNKNEILLLSSGNKLGYSKNPRTLHAFRCHFKTYSETKARSFELDFGDGETTVLTLVNSEKRIVNSEVYDLQGRKLNGKPTKKGLYIHNGKAVVIK